MNLIIYIDGGSRGNPGPAAAGVVILDHDTHAPLHEAGYCLGTMTNNKAEYQGLLIALETAAKLNANRLDIYSDSQLMVQQIMGRYRVKSPGLIPLHQRATSLLSKFDTWRITHVRREKNQRADELANMAMDAKQDVILAEIPAAVNDPSADNPKSKTPSSLTDSPHPVPSWTARLAADPAGQCPARCSETDSFTFGPTTPAGCCVFLAQAVLTSPLFNPDSNKNAPPTHTPCPGCGVAIKLQRAD